MTQFQKVFLGIFFIVVSLFSAHELADEMKKIRSNGEFLAQSYLEIILLFMSLSMMIYFIYLFFKQIKSQRELEANLNKVREQLENSNIRLRDGKKNTKK